MRKKIILVIIFGICLFFLRYSQFNFGLSGKGLLLSFWFIISLIFAIDGRFSVLIGIILLLFTSGMLMFNHEGLALRISLYSYGFIFIGAVIQFISLLKEKEDE